MPLYLDIFFNIGSGVQTEVLMFARKALHGACYLSSPIAFLKKRCAPASPVDEWTLHINVSDSYQVVPDLGLPDSHFLKTKILPNCPQGVPPVLCLSQDPTADKLQAVHSIPKVITQILSPGELKLDRFCCVFSGADGGCAAQEGWTSGWVVCNE